MGLSDPVIVTDKNIIHNHHNQPSLNVIPIHKRPDLVLNCADLINSEWPRSIGARVAQLSSSRDQLPTSLVLLKEENYVLAHIKLTPIPSDHKSCFVETVVVDKGCRGQGHGTFLMLHAENYCKNFLHLNTVYLSTIDQVRFYQKLGYEECEPISIYGTPNFRKPNPISRKVYMRKFL